MDQYYLQTNAGAEKQSKERPKNLEMDFIMLQSFGLKIISASFSMLGTRRRSFRYR